MSSVGMSRDGSDRSLPSGRVAVLGVLVVLALIAVAVLIGRWSASTQAPGHESGFGPAATVPAAPAPSPLGPITGGDLPGGGVLNGGGPVCLLARPC